MKHCLVVDDSRVVRKVARKILEELKFDISEAEDGAIALTACRGQMPDAILLDWNMPNMSGIEFTRALRQVAPSVPILMVTTRSVREDIMAAIEAGVSNYVVKPFTPQLLKEKIDAVLAGQATAA